MKRSPLLRKTPLASRGQRARANGIAVRSRAISPASREQRAKVKDVYCIAGGGPSVCVGPLHPAHVIDRSITTIGQDDARAIVALCAYHHHEYDAGRLDLLPWLEARHRTELAFAVERVGLISTLRRVTNDRLAASRPLGPDARY